MIQSLRTLKIFILIYFLKSHIKIKIKKNIYNRSIRICLPPQFFFKNL